MKLQQKMTCQTKVSPSTVRNNYTPYLIRYLIMSFVIIMYVTQSLRTIINYYTIIYNYYINVTVLQTKFHN